VLARVIECRCGLVLIGIFVSVIWHLMACCNFYLYGYLSPAVSVCADTSSGRSEAILGRLTKTSLFSIPSSASTLADLQESNLFDLGLSFWTNNNKMPRGELSRYVTPTTLSFF